jgi:MipA family protein
MKLIRLMFSALITVIFSVSMSHAEENSNFSIGLVAVAGSSIYSNDKTRSAFMPSLSYNSEKISVSFEKGLSYKFFDDGKSA